MNTQPGEAPWTSNAAAGVFTQRKLTLIISRTVIKGTHEVTWGSHLIGLELNKARSRQAADWLIKFTGSEQFSGISAND